MKEQQVSSVSPKGQITIPIEFRRMLGLKPKDKVSIEAEDGELRVKPAKSTAEQLYGSVTPLTNQSVEDVIMEAKVARIAQSVQKMQSE